MDSADVVVVGAGPAGCACALSFARRGVRVLLLEARRAPVHRLAGEWIQPAGVAALRLLGVDVHRDGPGTAKRGFVMHPGDGSAPIALPFSAGEAVSLPHAELTALLRRAVADHPAVELRTDVRVLTAEASGLVRTSRGSVHGELVVGADGRASVIRAALRAERADRTPFSYTAGLLLPDAALPRERYGHVMLGGPGPALAYRLNTGTVRLCLDVPPGRPPAPALRSYLWHGYAEALPACLRTAVAEQLRAGRVQWAANLFQPHAFYGSGRRALVGDAAGCVHPLSASGLTSAFLDGECLARSADVAAYARERSAACRVSDRLAACLHRILTDRSPATRALREAMFTVWREDERRRDRMLRLLAMTELRRHTFGTAFLHVLARALSSSARKAVIDGQWAEVARELTGFAGWLQWIAQLRAGAPASPAGVHRALALLGP
ncbi:FAD-dependent monooxygenase [Streptomyces sp. ISL-22]|uniref:FAD-dependent oxidoreductase n=1 Tax=unclassified Streptomyces TaxID=2593676 RepID=UPI001BE9D2B4|nr:MULTISPECIES: FAD-dependent oxidoreductase [unclassified Streptomyces]MBT2420342.1 FAD-dependent monooxygenase [Streptomyces sp. ISL-24]MBT2433044.1 FAD-dependent monooxygenase [Streptomyces sp. ISL-22]